MVNMGYCRFQNTLADLQDCYEHIGFALAKEVSLEEQKACSSLIQLCQEIVDNYGE